MIVVEEYEVLSMGDRDVGIFAITRFEEADVQFPRMGPIPPRAFRALKIHVEKLNGVPVNRDFWIDSKRLIYELLRRLKEPGAVPGTYKIRKHGFPPRSYYEVERL